MCLGGSEGAVHNLVLGILYLIFVFCICISLLSSEYAPGWFGGCSAQLDMTAAGYERTQGPILWLCPSDDENSNFNKEESFFTSWLSFLANRASPNVCIADLAVLDAVSSAIAGSSRARTIPENFIQYFTTTSCRGPQLEIPNN